MLANRPELLKLEARALPRTGPLLPLASPPLPDRVPAFPIRQRPHALYDLSPALSRWICSTYVVPAAYPRSVPGSVRQPGERRWEAGKDIQVATEELSRRQVELSLSSKDYEADVSEPRLFQVVNRYAPATPRALAPGGERVSVVLVHGTGLFKETWEPLIAELLKETTSIDEIWALDAINHGESGIINSNVLGDNFDWTDYGRDISAFLLSPLFTTSLPPSAPRETLAVGHSFGGTGVLFSASLTPTLFSSLLLLEPIAANYSWSCISYLVVKLSRRCEWDSRAAAMEHLRKGLMGRWDPRVLERYVSYGLRKREDGRVVLTTRKEDDTLHFATPLGHALQRAYTTLQSLPASLPTKILFAERGNGKSFWEEDRMDALPEEVPQARVRRCDGMGHAMVEETPGLLAKEIGRALGEMTRGEGGGRL